MAGTNEKPKAGGDEEPKAATDEEPKAETNEQPKTSAAPPPPPPPPPPAPVWAETCPCGRVFARMWDHETLCRTCEKFAQLEAESRSG